AMFQRGCTQEAVDRHLSDRDQHPGLEDAELGIEPVGAVGDSSGGRPKVACAGGVPSRKAAHQGGDVGQPAELLGTVESGAQHPAVELLSRATRERTSRHLLGWAWGLADQKEWRPPLTFEGWVGLRDDAVIDAGTARAACSLMGAQARLAHPTKLTGTMVEGGPAAAMPCFDGGLFADGEVWSR